jgi:hypothetical protein
MARSFPSAAPPRERDSDPFVVVGDGSSRDPVDSSLRRFGAERRCLQCGHRRQAQRTAPTSRKETAMNTNLRALIFGSAVAAVMTLSLNTVYAAEQPEIIRLEPVMVIAHAHAA